MLVLYVLYGASFWYECICHEQGQILSLGIPKHMYNTESCIDEVKTICGIVPICAIVTVPISVKSVIYELDLRLLDVPCPSLFGRDWINETHVTVDEVFKALRGKENKIFCYNVCKNDSDIVMSFSKENLSTDENIYSDDLCDIPITCKS